MGGRAWIIMAVSVIIFAALLAEAMGVNYGTLSAHPLSPRAVVELIKANNITKVKLFDADIDTVKAFASTNIELMVAIPNLLLENIASGVDASDRWVKDNVARYTFPGGVNIKYIAVGNEPFLKAYNASFNNVTVPALLNIQQSLANLQLSDQVKATVPLNADVLTNGNSSVPSAGVFRPDISQLMTDLVTALDKTKSPFTINIYPFLSLALDPNFPKDFAFFDGSPTPIVDGTNVYTNVFDANYDLLISALKTIGFPNMPVLIGEVGWPTDGDISANVVNAQRFNQELVKHVLSTKGTPLRPGPLEVYLFGLLDEDAKSIAPGNFERHWGIYTFDGQAKYPLDLSGNGLNNTLVNAPSVNYLPEKWCVLDPSGDRNKLADNVAYACTYADCTALTYGGSCNSIGSDGNASYAFNSYYQLNKQEGNSCYFEGLGLITFQDPSIGTCMFKVGLASSSSLTGASTFAVVLPIILAMFFSF